METNQRMLMPPICEACVLRRRKKASRKIVSLCLFIAYNVFIISVISVTLWYMNDRLQRLEKSVAEFKEQNKTPEKNKSFIKPIPETPLMIKSDHDNRLAQNSRTDTLVEPVEEKIEIREREKRGAQKRRKRCKNCLPVVQIEGSGNFGNEDKSDLSNLWVTPSWVDPKDKTISKYFDVSSVTTKGKLKVKEKGLYILYAQMNLIGPSVKGFEVFMEDDKSTAECIASCKRNSNLVLTEHCFTMKVVRLSSNTSVFIQEMEHNNLSDYLRISSVFGLLKIGS